MIRILPGDARLTLKTLRKSSVQVCVTSPPYWGLRDYGTPDQIGLEKDPEDYVTALVGVFGSVRNALCDDGVLWLNLGDSFAASGKGGGGKLGARKCLATIAGRKGFRMPPAGYKMKDLTLMPFAVAEALRDDGWYLRQTIIWRKNSAGEPMRADRPATSHEYIFLLSKSKSYFCKNPGEKWWGHSVWDINRDRSAIHIATMPEEIARRCIVSSSIEGDVIVDPFGGAGTTALVAERLTRDSVICEINEDYIAVAATRLKL